MNNIYHLVMQLKEVLLKPQGNYLNSQYINSQDILDDSYLNNFSYRISMQSDLKRVIEHGSSRKGLSDKLWDKLPQYDKNDLPYYPIKHEDIIIASEWNDLYEDSLLENGTLRHKLEIYDRPFFTLYHRSSLLELGREEAVDMANQGRHYLFLNPALDALHSLWQIETHNNGYSLKLIICRE